MSRSLLESVIAIGSRALEDEFEVRGEFSYCPLAILDLHEGEDDDDYLEDEDYDADNDREVAKAGFLVVVAAPSSSPVDYPDEIDQQTHRQQVPDAGFLFDVGVVPEEKHEGEEREVVVWPLEVGEQRQHDHHHEQFVYVLNHRLKIQYRTHNNPITDMAVAITSPSIQIHTIKKTIR